MSTDVLARVVEVVSGMEMDQFVHERILRPLRMNKTGYWVEPAGHGRIAEPQILAAPDLLQRPQGAELRPVRDAVGKVSGFTISAGRGLAGPCVTKS